MLRFQIYLKLGSLDTFGSNNNCLYVCRNKKVTRSNCPKRILAAVGEIIYKRREEYCVEESAETSKIIKEISELKKKVCELQSIVEESQL